MRSYQLLEPELAQISKTATSIGDAIEQVGNKVSGNDPTLQDLSKYQVMMLWPVTDSTRISRIQQFTDSRQGYKLNWSAWFQSLNADEQRATELRELNRARLYFDVRLIPIAAADLQAIYKPNEKDVISRTALDRFSKTHFYSIATGSWNPDNYAPLRERESQRADAARTWYETVTGEPTLIGKSIAKALTGLGMKAHYEAKLRSPHGTLRADVLADRGGGPRSEVIVELKAFAPENTRPSSISEAVRATLRKHALFAGFLRR
ncbi:MAG: hypothetical protein Q7T86_12430 [Hyphomicrobiaceae bacterium]|nr:hypothetical protein [Hyphomicrobiaceae bacterium]